MVTDKKQALEGLKNGTLDLMDISLELRSDEDIAIVAIMQKGPVAVEILNTTNSLPHTPEVFKVILTSRLTNIKGQIDKNADSVLEDFEKAPQDEIDRVLEENLILSRQSMNLDSAIAELNKYTSKLKIPEKGGIER